MPSKEWFEENPKVSAYISKELHQSLETWMKDKGIKKVSQALTEILEQFLHNPQTDQALNYAERIETLERRFAELEGRVTTVNLAIAEIQSSPTVIQSSDKLQLSLDDIAKPPIEQPEQPASAIKTHKEDSSLNIDQDKLKPKMTNREVSDLTGLTYNQVEGRHKRGTLIEESGKVFTPIRESGKPMWDVQDT